MWEEVAVNPQNTTVNVGSLNLNDILLNLAWGGTYDDAGQRCVSHGAITEAKAALEAHYREKYLGVVLGCAPEKEIHEHNTSWEAGHNDSIDTYTQNIKNKFEEGAD